MSYVQWLQLSNIMLTARLVQFDILAAETSPYTKLFIFV